MTNSLGFGAVVASSDGVPRKAPGRQHAAPELPTTWVSTRSLTVEELGAVIAGRPEALGVLEVFYQPVVLLPSGHVSGFEALARVRAKDGALIPPSCFIPEAEGSGLILPLGLEVLREGVAAATAWRQNSTLLSTATVSVNVAPAQLLNPGVVQQVVSVLEEFDLPGPALILEVTESMATSAEVIPILKELQGVGVRVALDDFGTGFATLDMLRRVPVQILKLDRSFVAGVDREGADRAIVRAVIDLAESLGLSVIAEGVETQAQVDSLMRMGCGAVQGYFFARPGPDPVLIAQNLQVDTPSPRVTERAEAMAWTTEEDAAILAAARVLAGRDDRQRAAVHAVATAWAFAAQLPEGQARLISRLALIHDITRLSVDDGLPSVARHCAVVKDWMAAESWPPEPVHQLIIVARDLVQTARRQDPEIGPAALRDGCRWAAKRALSLGMDEKLVGFLDELASAPPAIVEVKEIINDLERRRLGRWGTADRLRSLVGITKVLSGTGDTMELLRVSLEEVRKIVGAATASLERWERDRGQLRCLVSVGDLGPGEETFPENEVYPLVDYTAARRVLLDGVTYINTIDDVDADPEARDLLISLHKYSSASVPIFIHGRLWGQLWFSTVVGEPPFTVGDIEVLMAVAGLMSGVIAQSEQLDRVARQAFQDPLTGIANRRAIDDDLRQLSEGRMSTAIALIDVDLLKETNDNQGHEAGDAALVAVAASLSRLTARLHSAVVGRLGGDEFALIVPDTDGAPQQTEMIEADLRQVRSDLLARGMPSVSYGVAYVRGNWSPREALSQADKRLYAAKRASKRAARRDPQPQLPGEVDA